MIIAYDTETYKFNKQTGEYKPVLDTREFTIGCIKTDTGITKFFLDKEEMYKWITKTIEKQKEKKRITYIYAHKADYDWYTIARNHLLDPKTKYILFNPFLAIHNEKGYFLDTMAFFKYPLAKLGELLGYKKLNMPETIKHPLELKAYVERDTEIVLQSILYLKKQLQILGFKPRKLLTSGQTAMTCFLSFCRKNGTEKYFTRYNKEKKRREVIPSKYPIAIRQAYRGGDNQAHKLGKFENVTQIDLNGWYADVMRKMTFPNLTTETRIHQPNRQLFLKYIKSYIGVAEISIQAPTTNHPVLPIRFGKYQVYPSNTLLTGTWTYIEIEQALQEGYTLEKINWCIHYKPLLIDNKPFNPLKEFIETLFPLEKKATTKIGKAPFKLLRNNLSGKFAQHRKSKEIKLVTRYEVMQYIEQGFKTMSQMEDKYIIVRENKLYEPSYVNPIISVYTTAKGRLGLHEEEKKIPVCDRLYKDTDGLIFKDNNGETLNKFKLGKELGDWKIEEKDVPCKILGEKRYYIGKTVHISGIQAKHRTIETIEDEKNVIITKMQGLPQALHTGKLENVGTFHDIELEMKPHNKNMLALPEHIDERHIGEQEIQIQN